MNVLFAYDDERHAEPLLRVQSHFAGFDIDFRPLKSPTSVGSWCDVVLLQEPPIREDILNCGKPAILLERIDGAQLRGCREHLHRVAGVIKGYIFRDRSRNNATFDRAHVEILHKAGITGPKPRHRDELPSPQIAAKDLKKICAGFGFGARGVMGDLVNTVLDFDAPRPVDVTFHGIVDYAGSEIETHRKLAIETAKSWKEKGLGTSEWGAGRPLRKEGYRISLLRSKTALCPFGWGESTHRDYQAMALGAVVIKPNMSYVECWPNIYRPGKTYLPCKPDWSDAHQIIRQVVDNWGDYRKMREEARKTVTYAWRSDMVAEQMVQAITRIIGRTEC